MTSVATVAWVKLTAAGLDINVDANRSTIDKSMASRRRSQACNHVSWRYISAQGRLVYVLLQYTSDASRIDEDRLLGAAHTPLCPRRSSLSDNLCTRHILTF